MTDVTNDGGGGEQSPNEWMRAAVHGPDGCAPEVGTAPVTTNAEADEHREQSGDDWARGALLRAQGGDPGYDYDDHLAASRAEAERAHEAHGDHLVAEGEHGKEWEVEAVRLHKIAQAADRYVSIVEADDPDKAANRGKGINQGPMGQPPAPSESAAGWFGRVLDNVSTRRRGGGPSGMGW